MFICNTYKLIELCNVLHRKALNSKRNMHQNMHQIPG